MKYFLSKTVTTEFTTLSFVAPHSSVIDGPGAIIHFCFDRTGEKELHGIDYQGELDVQTILDLQSSECEVEEVQFADIEQRLKECRFSSEINDQTIAVIRSRYSVDDELKVMKLDKTDAQYIEMMAWIDSCRADGNAKKVALGLIEV